ncbi:MAG: RecQ family ATP-dependent DNA helicase [Marinilabiliaceae bacterium]|nr:RecQ family ATP-dependent DNA helicase [Marinilabiliaceae bacterium]
MSTNYREILKQYWGYDSFRSLQEDIIKSVGEGKDTLGLMPTGGGKSITFQVPAMSKEGICLVVTPLIALMRDQVENLKQKGIKALAIHSGLTNNEILIALENSIHGGFKFLYLSPERLATDLFLKKLPYLNVNILAVDEAHCISQWGYDFRPSYLKIADIRQNIPDVPVLALTATATPIVVNDIQEKLLFKEKNLFQKSFERKNLAYVVRNSEDKNQQMLHILQSIKGTSIIYVRNRKKTRDYAQFLLQNGISADYFHAGLTQKSKDLRQEQWKKNQTRVMVSTNAFGMGIDKPDVRTVIHTDAPDSLEAYFQEAGRAGRDENKAYAVLLWSPMDITQLKKNIANSFPEIEIVKKVYDSLGNFFQIPVGDGLNETYDFNLGRFCAAFGFNIITVVSSLKILQGAGYVSFSEDVNIPSKLKILYNNLELYKFQIAYEKYDALIKILLRSYTGLFTEYAAIDEELVSKRLDTTRTEVYDSLQFLDKSGVVQYIPQRQTPLVTFTERRQQTHHLLFPPEVYKKRKEQHKNRVDAVIDYISKSHICRSKMLLHYFGQNSSDNCGQCDVCINMKKTELTDKEFETIKLCVIEKLSYQRLTAEQLVKSIKFNQDKVWKVIAWLEDAGILLTDEEGKLVVSG